MKSRAPRDKHNKMSTVHSPAKVHAPAKREAAEQPFCFSRPFSIETLPATGAEVEIEADERERAALAQLDDLPAIGQLVARFKVSKQASGLINVRGHLQATVTQICVVSLDPFDSDIEADVDVDFEEEGVGPKAHPEDADRDPPDSLVDGRIDLGALAAEFLSLSLDPYPKKPGAHFEEIIADDGKRAISPFSVLGKLSRNEDRE